MSLSELIVETKTIQIEINVILYLDIRILLFLYSSKSAVPPCAIKVDRENPCYINKKLYNLVHLQFKESNLNLLKSVTSSL